MALELCRGQVVQGGMHTLAHIDIFQELSNLLAGIIIILVVG